MQKNLPTNSIDDQQTTSFQPISQKREPEQVGSLYKEAEPRVVEKKELEAPSEVKEWVTWIRRARHMNGNFESS